jgi:Ser/Thr protein kinase RdoA (MazF antagonist)
VDEILELEGGMGNRGHVVRHGDVVYRPRHDHSAAVAPLLEHLAAAGFPAPVPLGTDEEGREAYRWIEGDVPVSPFPSWSLTDDALASVGRLLRRYHEAVRSFTHPPGTSWFHELADPMGGPILCHNDVCPENVVFRDGEAFALLDFDFAAPGRPLWDLAATARMWIPLRPPDLPDPRSHLDRLGRLRVLAEAYEVAAEDREAFVDAVAANQRIGSAFVRRRVRAGEPAFVDMWRRRRGEAGVEQTLAWLRANRQAFLDVLQ